MQHLSKRGIERKISVLSFGAILLFLSLTSAFIFLFLKIRFSAKQKEVAPLAPEENTTDKKVTSSWEEYINNDYKYRILFPRLLYKREYKDVEGYKSFVRFEETNFSLGKGVAVGVRELSLDDEVKKIKTDFSQFGDAVLSKEEKIKVGDHDAVILEYHVQGSADEEDRSIVVVNKDGYSYSISTVPEQMPKVISSFMFL